MQTNVKIPCQIIQFDACLYAQIIFAFVVVNFFFCGSVAFEVGGGGPRDGQNQQKSSKWSAGEKVW